jgi:hypothetical protein
LKQLNPEQEIVAYYRGSIVCWRLMPWRIQE